MCCFYWSHLKRQLIGLTKLMGSSHGISLQALMYNDTSPVTRMTNRGILVFCQPCETIPISWAHILLCLRSGLASILLKAFSKYWKMIGPWYSSCHDQHGSPVCQIEKTSGASLPTYGEIKAVCHDRSLSLFCLVSVLLLSTRCR